MSEEPKIFPRSPLEMMHGWMHLPRLIDKIRLDLAGKLAADYRDNLLKKGFDQRWLEAANVEPEKLVEMVKSSITDGEVCDWIVRNVRNPVGEKESFNEFLVNYGREGDELRELLLKRKTEAGMADRDDIQCFVEFIDADEGRI